MIDYTVLPTVNATLNAISGIFLLVGYVLIRRRQINAHRNAMLGAFGSSTVFLISYLDYHAQAGSRDVVELHGNIRRVKCLDAGHVLPGEPPSPGRRGTSGTCQGSGLCA